MDRVESGLDLHDPEYFAEAPTDLTLFSGLADLDLPGHALVNFPCEKACKRHGYEYTQGLIDRVTGGIDRNYLFLCQFILVSRFRWYGNLVFTPHCTIDMEANFRPVPHYSLNVLECGENNGDLLFSFVGAAWTHPVRQRLVEGHEHCIDAGEWISSRYLNIFFQYMERSRFSLCPRGTGISSIRLFETMGMRRVPVIIADGYRPPLDWLLDWNEFSVTVPEAAVDNLESILSRYTDAEIRAMSDRAFQVWFEYFRPEVMHRVVVLEMERIGCRRQP